MRDDFPLPDTEWEPTREFWGRAARDELVLPRCDGCGAWCWYPRRACRACGHDTWSWVPVSGRGTLFSWTVVRHAFLPQFRDLVPFVTGLVSVDEDPAVRLATRVVDCDPDDLRCGLPVAVVFRDLQFPGIDRVVRAPMFRPV
jgi:uncharacterized OB-fold protein